MPDDHMRILIDAMDQSVSQVIHQLADVFDMNSVRDTPMTGATVAEILRNTADKLVTTDETEGTNA